jgi:hypothetical protein
MRAAVLLGLVGCIDTSTPDLREMVVYRLHEMGDVEISDGMIHWVDGMGVREAPLATMPIAGDETPMLGETRAPLLVHDGNVYMADIDGVMVATAGTTRRIVDEYDIGEMYVDDSGSLYWAHTGNLSWHGGGGLTESVDLQGDGTIGIARSGNVVYAATTGYYSFPPFGTLGHRSYLFEIQSGNATPVAEAADFQDQYVDDSYSVDKFISDGVFAIEGKVYWSVRRDVSISQQTLVVDATDASYPLVLGPHYNTLGYWVHDGAFYWTEDESLWRQRVGGNKELVRARVYDDFARVVAVVDGYVYGYVKSISLPDGWDLQRLPLGAFSGQ